MKFIIITGLSGAGKSETLKVLEDQGYYCIANLPPALLKDFIDIARNREGEYDNIALIVNTKEGHLAQELINDMDQLNDMEIEYETLFLESTEKVLTKRFKELRRPHPLNPTGSIIDGIEMERTALEPIRNRADHIIDTSNLTIARLREEITDIFLEGKNSEKLSINVISFGFKKGIPLDIDLLFDVRFLPNPYYIEKLRPLTGNDREVRDYVMGFEESELFLKKLKDMVEFLIPYYVREGKSQLIIGIGCTGGRHRSVTLANELYEYLSCKDYRVTVNHREQEK